MLRLIFWIGMCCLWEAKALAFDEATFTIESASFSLPQANDYSLGSFPQRLTEGEIKAALKEGRFLKRDTYSLEYRKYFYFAYLVDNKGYEPRTVYIMLPGVFPESQLYTFRDDQLTPWQRYPSRFDAFYATLPPGKTIVVGHRLSGGTFSGKASDVKAFDLETLSGTLRQQEHVIAWLLGAVFIMVFYSLSTFILFQRSYFLYYAAYSLCSLGALSSFSGQIEFEIRGFAALSLSSTFFLLIFGNNALSVRKHLPRFFRVAFPLGGLVFLLCLVGWVQANILPMATGTTLAIIYCVTGSWLRWRQGYQPAALLLIGWFLLGTGILLTLLNFLFWGHPYLNWALIVGYALELLFFSLAIQQKARLSEQKTIRAHEHAFLQLQKVFYPHQIERMKEGAQLETTMPTGPADACVLAFDVVASSRLPSEHAKGFLEEALKSSLALLSQDYDPKTLSARGYRIKEMGDGFLCSVGYPFASPGHQRNEEAAVKLALDMITVFESVVQKHFGDHRVFCAIGIASERLESFFPKAGTVEYDVYGRAIVLATRYESARNVLFREGIQGHVIILHSKVYRALPASLRDSFSRVDLSEQKFKIRDDEQATELAYRVFP